MKLILLYIICATITASYLNWLETRKGKTFEELWAMTVFWPFVWASALCIVIFDLLDSIVSGGEKNGGVH